MIVQTRNFETDEERWQAVVDRNPQAEGAFVYSVASTGVFCRPTCGARLPRRENVTFHAGPEQARRSGFRACRRCCPDGPGLRSEWAAVAARACRSIEDSSAMIPIAELAREAAMSASHFSRVFKQVTGMAPKAYALSVRSARIREGLAATGSITDAIYGAGFNSSSRFYESSNRALGMTPGNYRAGGAGEVIRFGLGECSLGWILVAATAAGVCAVLMDDDHDYLTEELGRRFPNAELVGGDPEFEGWMAGVIESIESPGRAAQLPVDIRGTAFQHLVWRALQQVPAGATASYSEIAERIGRPKAARAVAAACAANPVAVLVPCHRIVHSDGKMSGYRWGVERKQELLRRESLT